MADERQEGLEMGVVQAAVMSLQQQFSEFRLDFREHIDEERKSFKELGGKVEQALAWQQQATGGMKVARTVWGLWAFVVSTALAVLGWWKMNR